MNCGPWACSDDQSRKHWVDELAEWLEKLAANTHNLGLIPGTQGFCKLCPEHCVMHSRLMNTQINIIQMSLSFSQWALGSGSVGPQQELLPLSLFSFWDVFGAGSFLGAFRWLPSLELERLLLEMGFVLCGCLLVIGRSALPLLGEHSTTELHPCPKWVYYI